MTAENRQIGVLSRYSKLMKFEYPRIHLSDTKQIFAGQLCAGALSLIGTVLTARYCGPLVFGFCLTVILVLSVALDIVDFGACSWSARELASGRLSHEYYFKVMHLKTSTNLSYILIGPLIVYAFPHSHWSLMFIGIYPALWVRTNYIQQFLIVKEQIFLAVRLQIIERAVWLLIIPFQMLNINRWAAYIVPILTGLILHNFLGTRAISMFRVGQSNITELDGSLFQKSKYIGFMSVITDVSSLDTLIVARLSSLQSAASYGLAQRFRAPLLLGFTSFAKKLFPIAAAKNRSTIRALYKQEKNFLLLNYIFLFSTSIFFYIFGESIFGYEFQSINLILALGVLVAIPSSFVEIASSFLVATGSEHKVSKLYLISIPLTLLSVGITAQFQNVIGSVLALLIAKLIAGIFFYAAALKIWKEL